MRRLMTILAVCGTLMGQPFLATQQARAADDPFDFSSPLPANTAKPRTAQYFSRSQTARSQDSVDDGVTRYKRSEATKSTRNYADDLFRQGREIDRSSSERNPQEALRRFDDFLKQRNDNPRDVVVAADYTDSEENGSGMIRQVQAESPFGTTKSSPFEEPQSPFGRRAAKFKENAQRLTDPIATAPTADVRQSNNPNPFETSTAFATQTEPEAPTETTLTETTLKLNHFGTISAPKTTTPSIRQSYANNTASAASITTSWQLLGPLNVGQECTAEITIQNSGESTAERISLEARMPQSVRVVKAVPEPVEQRSFLGWKFEELAAGQSQTIRIVFIAETAGALDVSAHVRHTSSRNHSFTVSKPMLEVVVTGPDEVHLGEPASQTVIVKNPGTGVATNVKLEAVIPTGLEHARGERLLMEIGTLNPGEVRSVRLAMGAIEGGEQILQVQATADAGLVQTAAAEVRVIAPSLKTAIDGPGLRYLGREAQYTIRVLNDGTAATDNVQCMHRIPDGFGFVSADRGAKFDPSTRMLNWFVGRMESEQSQDMLVTLIAEKAGEFVHAVRATSEHGAKADAQVSTRIEGAASLVVKVSDLDDPVEVGSETAYEVTVINEGTASALNVSLACEIPEGLTFLKADGPSEHRLESGTIGFRPIDELAAGKSVTFHVFVRGQAPGDQRFRCRLTSDTLTQPLFTEELTKFYGE